MNHLCWELCSSYYSSNRTNSYQLISSREDEIT
jgi:hypothetical protein